MINQPKKRHVRHAAYYLQLILLVIGVLEIAARWMGFMPTPSSGGPGLALTVPDPELGWVHRHGAFTIERASGERARFTIGEDGARSNGDGSDPVSDARNGNGPILMIGGSFTVGSQYLDDAETLPALLQRRIPDTEIKNFGTFAFGTYQSYLLLQRLIEKFPMTQGVIYGFVDFHEYRNVADPAWHAVLQDAAKGEVRLPYVLRGEDNMLRAFSAEAFPRPMLARHSALAAAMTQGWVRLNRFQSEDSRRAATILIIEQMRRFLRKRNIRFLVAFLRSINQPKPVYSKLLRSANIPFMDCAPDSVSSDMALEEDGHPSPLLNEQWAACIEQGWASE